LGSDTFLKPEFKKLSFDTPISPFKEKKFSSSTRNSIVNKILLVPGANRGAHL
jgi:hypothetical protein